MEPMGSGAEAQGRSRILPGGVRALRLPAEPNARRLREMEGVARERLRKATFRDMIRVLGLGLGCRD